jgi:signal peptide peptidase SppA
MFGSLFSGLEKKPQLPKNTGVPSEQYVKVTHWNSKLSSYRFSMQAAAESKAAAAAEYRRTAFERAVRKALPPLDPAQRQALLTAEQAYLKEASQLTQEIQTLEQSMTTAALQEELIDMGFTDRDVLEPAVKNTTSPTIARRAMNKQEHLLQVQQRQWTERISALRRAERTFLRAAVGAVGPDRAAALKAALTGGSGGSLLLSSTADRPLTRLLVPTDGRRRRPPRVYVTRFAGDVSASQVTGLREEVTAIVRAAEPGEDDEVVVVLRTGGGTVTGYGLAAAQLMRFREAGLNLTVAVEQVAASGGYMMACTADRIVASPFAVLGSIGVVSDIPNVYERLKTEGIEFQTVTAGKYKRTLTPTKKVTKEDYQKTKEDIEDILVLFRDFVAERRPALNIDEVATGETWLGTAALERGLCDEIKTVDDVLTDYVDAGYDVFEVKYDPPPARQFGRLLPATAEAESVVGLGARWLVRTVARAVSEELGASDLRSSDSLSKPIEQRYMALDDAADRIRSQG